MTMTLQEQKHRSRALSFWKRQHNGIKMTGLLKWLKMDEGMTTLTVISAVQ